MAEPIKWKVREFMGCEVYRTPEDLKAGKTVTDSLKEGEQLMCPALNGWMWGTVQGDEHGFFCKNDNYIWPLEFNKDDRHCWIAAGMINKKCLAKLKLYEGKVRVSDEPSRS